MIQDRPREAFILIVGSIVISLIALSISGPIDFSASTGFVVLTEDTVAPPSEVSVVGTMFTASINGDQHTYIFSEEKIWFELMQDNAWHKRAEMGKNIFSGLLYLQGINAKVYYKGNEVTDFNELIRELK